MAKWRSREISFAKATPEKKTLVQQFSGSSKACVYLGGKDGMVTTATFATDVTGDTRSNVFGGACVKQ